MRTKFDEQLSQLYYSLIEMGAIVEKAIANAEKALWGRDTGLAQAIISSDDEIDNKEREIEGLCLKLILMQQPVARDLRLVSAALKMVTDLERIGDHASDISELTILLSELPGLTNIETISQMADATMKMVKDSINAFVKKDADLANEVIAYDDVVDDLFVQTKNKLMELTKENVINIAQAIDYIMVAKYYERIGDHATNIAEWVIFSLTGTHKNKKLV